MWMHCLGLVSLAKGSSEIGEIDPDTKAKILQENKTYEAIKRDYQWPNMKKEVVEYVKKCAKCQLNKTLRPKGKAPMEITTTARHPFVL